MNYERMIHEYLDNELDKSSEELLFAELSVDESLRSELNRQKKLINLAQSDMSSISVPLSATTGIFNKIGVPLPETNNISLPELPERKSAFRYSGLILLLLLLFTSGTAYYLFKENLQLKDKLVENKSIQQLNEKEIPITSSYSDNSSFENEIFGFDDNANSDFNNVNIEKSKHNSYTTSKRLSQTDKSKDLISLNNLTNTNYADANQTSGNDGSNLNNLIIVFPSKPHSNVINGKGILSGLRSSRNNDNANHSSQLHSQLPESFRYSYMSLLNSDNSRSLFSISIRKMSSEQNYPPPVVNAQESSLSNFSAGIAYNYSNEWSFSIEFGIESFAQQFTSQNLNYTQTPELFWSGLTVRYTPMYLPMSGVITPYISQTLAYTKIGPLSRTQIGINVIPSKYFGVFAGAEYGTLFYSLDDNIYNSGKLGWTAGLIFNIR